MLAQYLVFTITFEALGAEIPTGDSAFRIEHENRVVLHAFDHQTEPLLAFPQHLLRLLALGDVGNNSADGVNAVVYVSQGKLRDDTRAPPIGAKHGLLKLLRHSCGELLAIVGVQLIRLLCRKEFAVGFADNLISTSAAELLKRKITIEVTPIRLFQENHRGTMVQNSSKLLLVFVKRFFNALAVDNFIRQISDDGCELFPPLEELSFELLIQCVDLIPRLSDLRHFKYLPSAFSLCDRELVGPRHVEKLNGSNRRQRISAHHRHQLIRHRLVELSFIVTEM